MTKLQILVVVWTLIHLSCSSSQSHPCPTATCADYATQQAAQATYNKDPACYKNLDTDGDGIACEQLPGSSSSGTNGGSSTGCPTTANCGCSNKTKSQCASACCKWVVGTGCVCR